MSIDSTIEASMKGSIIKRIVILPWSRFETQKEPEPNWANLGDLNLTYLKEKNTKLLIHATMIRS